MFIQERSSHPNLVITILSDVPNPWKGLVSAFLLDLEVSHLNTAYCKVWDFELDLNWHSRILLSLFCVNTWEAKLSSHYVLLPSWELLYAPDHAVLIRNILDCSYIRSEDRRVNICRDWHKDFNVICNRLWLELSFGLDYILYLGSWKVFNNAFNPD